MRSESAALGKKSLGKTLHLYTGMPNILQTSYLNFSTTVHQPFTQGRDQVGTAAWGDKSDRNFRQGAGIGGAGAGRVWLEIHKSAHHFKGRRLAVCFRRK